jgi:protease II
MDLDMTRAMTLFLATNLPVLLNAMRAKYLRSQIPRAKKIEDRIYFGVNPKDPEEDRGPNAMNPPKSRVDYYNWLRDETRKDPVVLAHINAENVFAEEMTADLKPLQENLYEDMLSRLKETDDEVPYLNGDFVYYSRTVKGLSYKIHCRKSASAAAEPTGVEQIVLDENLLAAGHEYSDVSCHEPSPDHRLLAFAVDHNGYETYRMSIKDLTSGLMLDDVVDEISGEVVWGADSSTLFYMKMDEEHRPDRCYMHVLGTPQSEDLLVFQEDDARFWMGLDKTASDRFLVVGVESKETSEHFLLDLQACKGGAAHAASALRKVCVHPRYHGLRYDVEHHGDYLYIVTNLDGCKNNKLMRCHLKNLPWPTVVAAGVRAVPSTDARDTVRPKAAAANVLSSASSASSTASRPRSPSSVMSDRSAATVATVDTLASYGTLLDAAVATVKDAITSTLGGKDAKALPDTAPTAGTAAGAGAASSVAAPVVSNTPESQHWLEVKKYNPDVLVESVLPFADFFAIFGREGGLERVWLATKDDAEWRAVPFHEACHSVWSGANFVYSSPLLRLGYSSLVTPKQVLDYDTRTGAMTVLKRQEVPNYDPTLYESRRIHCTARDGRKVPMSVVYRKSVFADNRGTSQDELPRPAAPLPCLLYGYGSYGACIDPVFDYKKTALLDRGTSVGRWVVEYTSPTVMYLCRCGHVIAPSRPHTSHPSE